MATSQAESRPKSMAEAPAPARASRRSRVSNALKSGVVFGGSAVLSAVNNITPHIAGAVDIMVVEQPDGSRKATPFYVRFGKYTALRTGERNVKVYVNDQLAPFGMQIGMYGQAYFATETTEVAVADEDTQEAMLAGMMSPPSGYSSGGEGEGEGEGDASEAGDSNPSPQTGSLQGQPRLGRSGSSPSAPGGGSGPGRPRKPGRGRPGEGGPDTSQSAQASVHSSRSLPTPAPALGCASAPVLTQPTQQLLPNTPALPSKSQLQLQLQQQASAPPGGSSPPVHAYHPSLSLADRNESFLSACETLPTPLGDEQLAAAGINLGSLAASGSVHSLEAAAALERFFSLPQQRAVSGRRRGGVTPEGGRPMGLDRVSQGGEGDQEDEGGRSPTGWSEDGEEEGEGIRERALGGSSPGASSSGQGGAVADDGREGAYSARCESSGGDGGSRGGASPPVVWTPPGAPASGAPPAAATAAGAANAAATGGPETDGNASVGGHGTAAVPAAHDVAGQAPRPSQAPAGPAAHPALHMTQQLGFPDNPQLPTSPGTSPDYLTPGGQGALAAAARGDDDPTLDPHTAVLYSLPHTEVPVPLQTVPLAAVLAANGSGAPLEGEGAMGQGHAQGQGHRRPYTPHVSHAHAPHAVSLLSSSLRSKAGELGASSPGVSPAPSQRPLGTSLWGDGSGAQGDGSGAGGDEQRRQQRPVRVSLEATRSGHLHMQLSLPSEAGEKGGAAAGPGSSPQATAGAAAATPFCLGPEGLRSSASLQVHPSTLPQSIPTHQQHAPGHHHDPYDHPHGASVAAGPATGPPPLHGDIPHSASAPVARTGAGPIASVVPPAQPHAPQPALPSPLRPRPAAGGRGLCLSLCGARLSPGMPYKDAAALFDEHTINEESYIAAGPSLLSSAELCIKLGSGAIYPWHTLSSSLLGLLVFGSWRTPPEASCWLPDGLSPGDILPPSSAAALLAVADGLAAAGGGGGGGAAGRSGLVVPSHSDAGAGAGEDSTVGQSPGGTPKKPEQGGQATGSSWRLWPFGGRRGGAGRGSVTGKSPPLLTSPLAERATSLSGSSSMPVMPARSESTAGAGAGLAAAAAAVVAELAADGDCGPLGAVSAPPVSVAAAAATAVPPLATMSAPVAGGNDPRFTMVTRKSLTPTPEELAALPLQYGQNTISYKIGTTELKAYVYFLPWRTKIVISDIDGTITKSDVLGHLLPPLGWDWSHPGIAQLLTSIRANAYLVMYLSSRSIGQANVTRDFINTLVQGEHRMPLGPVIISPHGLLPSLYREMILRRPHEFKIATLQDIRALFPPFWNPFYGGFGNRDTDEISYREVGVPASRIFIINPKGELRQPDPSTSPPSDDMDHDPELGLGIASPRAPPLPPAPRAGPPTLSSLAAINDLVHHIFPPLVAGEPLAVAVTHLSAAAAAAAVVAAVTDGEEREQQRQQQQEEDGNGEGSGGDEDGPPQLVALGGREQEAAGGQGKEEGNSVRVLITPTVDGTGVRLRLAVRQGAGAGPRAGSRRGSGDQDGGDDGGDAGDSSSSNASEGGVSNGGGPAGASPQSSTANNAPGGAGKGGRAGAPDQGRSPPGSPFAARASQLRVEVKAVEVTSMREHGGGTVGVVAASAVPQVA